MHYEKFTDRQGQFRWRYVADNHEILAVSAQGYVRKEDRDHCIKLIQNSSAVQIIDKDVKHRVQTDPTHCTPPVDVPPPQGDPGILR